MVLDLTLSAGRGHGSYRCAHAQEWLREPTYDTLIVDLIRQPFSGGHYRREPRRADDSSDQLLLEVIHQTFETRDHGKASSKTSEPTG